jgi:hypothetical protein
MDLKETESKMTLLMKASSNLTDWLTGQPTDSKSRETEKFGHAGHRLKNGCASEGQQQFTQTEMNRTVGCQWLAAGDQQ